MKTIKQIREEYNNEILNQVEMPDEIMLEGASSIPSSKEMPAMLIFRRIQYRIFPNKQVVALYYSKMINKYLSIPYGPDGNVNLSESVILDENELKNLNEDGFDLDAVSNAIRSKESGSSGGYNAKSKSSSASGAYQYIDKTWKGSAVKSNVDTKQYPTARSAPKEVQDKVFQNDLQNNASKYGSLEKAVNVHYTGKPSGQISAAGLKANRGQTGNDYLSDIKKRVDSYNTERKSTMGAAQQMAANFGNNNKTLSTPQDTQYAAAKPTQPTQVASNQSKQQNPDQERTRIASYKPQTQVAESFKRRLNNKRQEKLDELAPLALVGSAANLVKGAVGAGLNMAKGALGLMTNPLDKMPNVDDKNKKGPIANIKKKTSTTKTDVMTPLQASKMRQAELKASTVRENKISDIRKSLDEGNSNIDLQINGKTITLNNGTAKRIVEVYDSVNTKNKKIVEGMLNEDLQTFKKLINFTIKV